MTSPRTDAHVPTYHVWTGMRQRCMNPAHPQFKDWGGRGITICARWSVYTAFLADMGEKPAGLTIERIDNDKGYEPGNCRWATYHEQRRNTRDTVVLTHAGETMCAKDWAARVGLNPSTLYARLDKGWDVARALTSPPVRTGRPKAAR